MLKLRIIQAEYGDCFILEFGTQSRPKYILIDGGPKTIYKNHLRGELQKIRDGGGKLDLAILSHVDEDHVIGLLSMVTELRKQKANHTTETITVDELWHNSVNKTIDSDNDIENRVNMFWANVGPAGQAMSIASMEIMGINQGHQLRLAATAYGIPINNRFTDGLICVDNVSTPVVFDNLNVHIVGPTKENLKKLRKKWLDWLDQHEDTMAGGDPFLADMIDSSIPNLSSIMILTEAEGKKILLTGDGRGDHLIQGLNQANLLNPEGGLHVDILKIPHHGSDRNVSRKFFKTITADKYVISANGKHGNPELATFIWIVEAAKEQNRNIEIIVTNETPSTEQFVKEYDPTKYNYRLTKMSRGSHTMLLKLTS